MTRVLDPQNLKLLHRSAMEQVDLAAAARRAGEPEVSRAYLENALELESEAAQLLISDYSMEPTRSILYRSAASLAKDIGDFPRAERLIAQGLSGLPPEEIADELRDLYEQVTFERHLALRGVQLQNGEFQLSIAGPSVGAGIVPADLAYQRVMDVENLILRTAERKSGRPFRKTGSPPKEIKELYEAFVTVPRVASFAITVRLGGQLTDLMGSQQEVITDVVDNLKLVQEGKEEELNEIITDSAYFTNFIGLAGKLAPDGEKVTLVGITTTFNTQTRHLALQKPRKAIQASAKKSEKVEKPLQEAQDFREVSGILEIVAAKGNTDTVRLKRKDGGTWTVIVPEGLMDDVVVPFWRKSVIVQGIATSSPNVISLKSISETNDQEN